MMETLRGWLLGLTAAALAVSLLTAMLPKGETIRRIGEDAPHHRHGPYGGAGHLHRQGVRRGTDGPGQGQVAGKQHQ